MVYIPSVYVTSLVHVNPPHDEIKAAASKTENISCLPATVMGMSCNFLHASGFRVQTPNHTPDVRSTFEVTKSRLYRFEAILHILSVAGNIAPYLRKPSFLTVNATILRQMDVWFGITRKLRLASHGRLVNMNMHKLI